MIIVTKDGEEHHKELVWFDRNGKRFNKGYDERLLAMLANADYRHVASDKTANGEIITEWIGADISLNKSRIEIFESRVYAFGKLMQTKGHINEQEALKWHLSALKREMT